MKHQFCAHEEAVAAAATSGVWTPELRAHRDGCMTCAELTLVVAALAADAEQLADEAIPLPDPGVLWFRAQLAERERVFKRATSAIVWVQRVAIAVVAAIGLAFAPGLWALIGKFVAGLNLGPTAAELPRAAGSPTLVLVTSLLVLGGLALWELTAVHEN
jgi:predicted anti-sigma-YlaC factor YlaD